MCHCLRMALPAFLHFTPVPVRGRHDGWTRRRQRLFILRLACGDGPAEAARVVGCSRQSAYALRRRHDAKAFAAAWDAAQDFAHHARGPAASLPSRETASTPFSCRASTAASSSATSSERTLRSAMRTLSRLDRLSHVALDNEGFDFDALVEQAAAGAEIDKADGISCERVHLVNFRARRGRGFPRAGALGRNFGNLQPLGPASTEADGNRELRELHHGANATPEAVFPCSHRPVAVPRRFKQLLARLARESTIPRGGESEWLVGVKPCFAST